MADRADLSPSNGQVDATLIAREQQFPVLVDNSTRDGAVAGTRAIDYHARNYKSAFRWA